MFIMTPAEELIAAQAVAKLLHRDQTDKAGAPYVLHLFRVAERVPATHRAIAWLHDIVEDTDVTLLDLYHAGFSPFVVDAVDALTHRANEPYESYIERLFGNREAIEVKVADIMDNLDPERVIAAIYAGADVARMAELKKRYERALHFLRGDGWPDDDS